MSATPEPNAPEASAPEPNASEMAVPEMDVLALARLLARHAGLPQPTGVTPLPGGRNNRVYRVDGRAVLSVPGGPTGLSASDGPEGLSVSGGPEGLEGPGGQEGPEGSGGPWLLKRYFSHPGDQRDRLGAEYAFLTRAAALGEARVPRPLARSDVARGEVRAALYSFAPGRALAAGEVRPEHVRQALDLALRLNARRENAQGLPVASEACFSLPQHLELVAGRVARLAALDSDGGPTDELDREALAFVNGLLAPALAVASAKALALAAPGDLVPLPAGQRCVSPSDFGFHNALLGPDGQLAFLDFEYAGWDDPAKLVCDFFLQPRVPAPWDCLGWFTDGLAEGLGVAGLARRVAALLPVYRVKWCCILLGEFLAVAGARRNFSAGADRADLARPDTRPDTRQRQLAQAQALLERDLQLP